MSSVILTSIVRIPFRESAPEPFAPAAQAGLDRVDVHIERTGYLVHGLAAVVAPPEYLAVGLGHGVHRPAGPLAQLALGEDFVEAGRVEHEHVLVQRQGGLVGAQGVQRAAAGDGGDVAALVPGLHPPGAAPERDENVAERLLRVVRRERGEDYAVDYGRGVGRVALDEPRERLLAPGFQRAQGLALVHMPHLASLSALINARTAPRVSKKGKKIPRRFPRDFTFFVQGQFI